MRARTSPSVLQRQLDTMRALMAWDPPLWIMGGFAEDALLHGRATRPHEDIDLVVLRDDLDLRLDQAEALGFGHPWHVRLARDRSRPLVIGSLLEGVNLEIVVFDRDDGGIYWEKPTAEGSTRLYMPDDAFLWQASAIHGVEVRTVSPRMLYQVREGVTDLFGGMRPKDVVSQRGLRERFFRDVPERELVPRAAPLLPG